MSTAQNHIPTLPSSENSSVATIHNDLLRLSKTHLRREPLRHLWSPECLVNEAYIRLVQCYGKAWVECENVIPIWSRIMRNVLIDAGRSVRAAKRNQGKEEPIIETQSDCSSSDVELVLRVRRAIDRLHAIDPRLSLVFRLRFTHGFTIEELSGRFGKSPRTIKRILRKARAQFLEAL